MGVAKFQRVFACAESTFSTDPDSDGSDYTQGATYDAVFTPTQESIERNVQRSGLGLRIPNTLGGKGGTLTFKLDVPGLTTAAASTVEAVMNTFLSLCLRKCGLAEGLGTGTTVTGSGSTTTSIDCTNAAGISETSLVMISGEVRVVTGVSSNTITVSPALSAIPSAATVVYSSASYVPSDADPGTAAFVVKGEDDEYTLLGCKGTVKLGAADARARPQFEFSFNVDNWSRTSKASLPAETSLVKPTPLTLRSSPFWWGATKYPISNVAFDPGFVVSPKPSTQGTQGRAGWVVTDENSVLSVKPYMATAWSTDFEALTERVATMQVGASAAGAFAVVFPKGQIVAQPNRAAVEGLNAHDITIRANDPQDADQEHFTMGFF
jgi:hypothetical protein